MTARSRLLALGAALAAVSMVASCTVGDGASSDRTERRTASGSASTTSTTAKAPPTTTTTTLVPPDGKTAADRSLTLEKEITGDLTPKSVVWSGGDRFFAQNMIYTHTIGVYDRSYQRLALIPDTVRLADFGYPQYPDSYQGGPVETDFTPDGKYAYVSNYQMYGPGFDNPGNDNCGQGDWDPSFVYRVDVAQLKIDQVIEVGSVPKYVQVSPDGKLVLVTNWCGYDMSVIDTATAKEVTRIPIGRYPRGIVVSPDSRTAYVAIMGGSSIAVVDLASLQVTGHIDGVGSAPRHLVLSPDGTTLYVTLNGEGDVAKIDLASGAVVGRGRDRAGAAEHGHLRRRDRAVHRELRVVDDEQGAHGRHDRGPGGRHEPAPDRHHLRRQEPPRLGGLLLGHADGVQRRVRPTSIVGPLRSVW